MRVESVKGIPVDLAAWYADTYRRVGAGRYQSLAYHSAHEFERLARTIDALRGIEGRRSCLEVGCSEGIITRELAKLFDSVVAVDICPDALAACPPLDNVRYGATDIETCEIASDFDVVVLSDVLEHLRNPRAVIQKCAAHARWIVAVGPTTEPLNEAGAFDSARLVAPGAPGDGTGHIWYMDREGFLSLFDGLRVEWAESGGSHHTVILARGGLP